MVVFQTNKSPPLPEIGDVAPVLTSQMAVGTKKGVDCFAVALSIVFPDHMVSPRYCKLIFVITA